jgi:hypothetical protein
MSDFLDQPEPEPAGLFFTNKKDSRPGPQINDADERPVTVGDFQLASVSEDNVIGYYIRTKEPFYWCVTHWDKTVPEKHGYYACLLRYRKSAKERGDVLPVNCEPLPKFIYAVQILEEYHRTHHENT